MIHPRAHPQKAHLSERTLIGLSGGIYVLFFSRGAFCVLVGISWGIVYFAYKILTGNVGMLASCGERNEEGNVKFFNLWILGLVSTMTMAGFLWLSLQEDSFVARIIADSFVYLFQPGIAG